MVYSVCNILWLKSGSAQAHTHAWRALRFSCFIPTTPTVTKEYHCCNVFCASISGNAYILYTHRRNANDHIAGRLWLPYTMFLSHYAASVTVTSLSF